jgi:hypothetical protein
VPLADRAIGNLQQWLITYHGVSRGQLQVYLDEFVFRHNRRKQPAAAFQTLPGLGTGRGSIEYRSIRGAHDLANKANHKPCRSHRMIGRELELWSEARHLGASQFTIHLTPNLSVTIPKASAQ